MMDLSYAIWIINPAATYILSADGQSIDQWFGPGPQPTQAELNAAWVTAQQQIAAAQAVATTYAQHVANARGLYAGITSNSAQVQADLQALQTIATALENGVQPTPAQQVIIDRVLVRMVIILLRGIGT